jgi:hypothetical protein
MIAMEAEGEDSGSEESKEGDVIRLEDIKLKQGTSPAVQDNNLQLNLIACDVKMPDKVPSGPVL